MTSEVPPPFLPVGPVARWKILYDLIRPLGVGEVLTYEAMGEALDLNPDDKEDRHVIQMAARRALKELLDKDHRASKAIKNLGYRVAFPSEHLAIGKDRNKRAGRQIQVGYSVATKVDMNGMEPEVRTALELMAKGLARQGEINRRVLAKQDQQEEAINLLMQRVDRLENG